MALCQLIFLVALPMVALARDNVVITIGKCPQVPTKADFDVKQYMGQWYQYSGFEIPAQYGITCVNTEYTLRGPNDVQAVNRGFLDVEVLDNRLFRINADIEGSVLAPDPEKAPGELVVSFFRPPSVNDTPNYRVIDTDYNTYSVLYNCQQDLFLRIESAYLLTRERGVAPAKMDKLIKYLKSFGVDVNYFYKTRQDLDCPPVGPNEVNTQK